jgi:hypothetical protein
MIFLKLYLSILLFLILSWLRITTVNFLMKHYRLLQYFPAWFFLLWFFLKKILFILFLNINLIKNLTLQFFPSKNYGLQQFFLYNFFFYFFYKLITTHKYTTSPQHRAGIASSSNSYNLEDDE